LSNRSTRSDCWRLLPEWSALERGPIDIDSLVEKAGAHSGHAEPDAANAICAAVAQMTLALRESQVPVAELGALLSHLSQSLLELRSAPFIPSAQDPVSAAALTGLLEQLQSDVFSGIQRLQFYDRMVQHLSHLQDYLVGVADELDSKRPEGHARTTWEQMHAKLRARLISDDQRGLLDVFLWPDIPTRVSAQTQRSDYSPPGSFEMF
jgi:hypothetical protein